MKGSLVKWDMVNPHSWFHLNVKGPDGKVVEWLVEGGSPNQLIRMGAADEDVDRRELRYDLGGLLNKYRGLPLKEIRAGAQADKVRLVLDKKGQMPGYHALRVGNGLQLIARVRAP